MKLMLCLAAFLGLALGDVSHILLSTTTTPPPPPKPYAFGYAAGRFPGHIDRTHSEVSDGTGTIKGSYSYVDPKFKIRTVEYVADHQGFRPVLSHTPPPLPRDSAAVAAAKERHFAKFAAIAESHQSGPGQFIVPVDSRAVQHAKANHQDLFQKIAEEHAQIAAEREALQRAEDATRDPNTVQYHLDGKYATTTTTTPPPPPKPYAFGYAAGRFPGHIDRTHSEVSDGSGVIKGSFSYVDPRHQIRTVDYVADHQGFHPVLNKTPAPLPTDSESVQKAKEYHLAKYAAIAEAHQRGVVDAVVPNDSNSVKYAKAKHFSLFQQIAEEHDRLRKENEARQLLEEAEEKAKIDLYRI